MLQEKPGGDGAAAVLAGVADVGIVAADQVLVLREVRHAPEPLAGVPGGPGQAAVPAVIGGHDAGGHIAQHGVHGSREGGDIHQVGAALPADGPGEAVSQDQAALGIGVEDLHGLAGKEGDPVAGEHAGGGDAVFTGGDHRRDVDPDSVPGQSMQGGGSRRAPGHVALDARHGGGGFQTIAAAVHGDALAHEAYPPGVLRRAGVPQHHQGRGVAAAAAYGQQAPEAQVLQLLPVVDSGFDGQTVGQGRQPGGEIHRRQQVGGEVYIIADGHNVLRQLPGGGELGQGEAAAGGIAGQGRTADVRQAVGLAVGAAQDALQGGVEARLAQPGGRGQVKDAAFRLQIQDGLDGLAVALLAGQHRPVPAAAHGNVRRAVGVQVIAGPEIVVVRQPDPGGDGLVFVQGDHASSPSASAGASQGTMVATHRLMVTPCW